MKPYILFQEILFSPFQLLYIRFFRSLARLIVLVDRSFLAFSIIELLVVIAVIGVLAGGIIALINPTKQLANARNAQRKTDLRSIANALEQYAIENNGKYPITGVGVWCNTSGTGGYACAGNNHLSGLISAYLKKIPTDPRNNLPNLFNASCPANNTYGYLYRSDTGSDYKILAYCTPETNQVSATDSMKDPSRSTTSWSVFSPGGSSY